MKRALIALLLVAAPVLAATEKWWDAYNRGVKAVNARSYDAAVSALQKAITEMPAEGTSVRAKNDLITYVPHFWLGIAKFNTGDVDGALREFKLSEDQGAVQKTAYYPQLRDWVSRAQAEKAKSAQAAASDSRKAADAALTKATFTQADALAAGGDRSESYRQATRKQQEALSTFQSAGSDIKAYGRAEAAASEANVLFAKAAADARQQRAARQSARTTQPVAVAAQKPVEQPVVQPPPVQVVQQQTPPPAPPPVETKAQVAIAQTAKAPVAQTLSASTIPAQQVMDSTARMNARAQLESAYRAFAGGRFDASEKTLSALLQSEMAGEAYLLRGCTRYTRAVLSRNPQPLLAEATNDFKAALKMNRKLRLDRNAFSPKLVAFFEQVRKSS